MHTTAGLGTKGMGYSRSTPYAGTECHENASLNTVLSLILRHRNMRSPTRLLRSLFGICETCILHEGNMRGNKARSPATSVSRKKYSEEYAAYVTI